MKRTLTKIFFAIPVFIFCLTGCQDDPTAQERAEALLTSGAWNNPTVTVDGVDHTDLYTNFTIQFSTGTYTSSGGGPLWPASGAWEFTDDSGKVLKLDGQLEIQLAELTESSLEIQLQWENSTFVRGRTMSVGGHNIFKLKKKI